MGQFTFYCTQMPGVRFAGMGIQKAATKGFAVGIWPVGQPLTVWGDSFGLWCRGWCARVITPDGFPHLVVGSVGKTAQYLMHGSEASMPKGCSRVCCTHTEYYGGLIFPKNCPCNGVHLTLSGDDLPGPQKIWVFYFFWSCLTFDTLGTSSAIKERSTCPSFTWTG